MMSFNNTQWFLPEGVAEVLPTDAIQLESVRRKCLDYYASWGYELVIPPITEYLDTLLCGASNDLRHLTHTLSDRVTGKLLGIRADITPQIARIDRHCLGGEGIKRLSYCGVSLRAEPDELTKSRSPLQIGAELFGHAGPESDVESLCLMDETLNLAGITEYVLDIGHVGIYQGLLAAASLSEDDESLLFEYVKRKALPEIQKFLAQKKLPKAIADALKVLPELNGDESVLGEARELFSGLPSDTAASVLRCIDNIEMIAALLKKKRPDVTLYFDLSELHGYQYHTGAVFAAYAAGQGQAIATGGRYGALPNESGQLRYATGFSTDLNILIEIGQQPCHETNGIIAAYCDDERFFGEVELLRKQGEKVVYCFPNQRIDAKELGCNRRLVFKEGKWEVELLSMIGSE